MPRYIFYVVNILVNIILYLLHKTHYIHLRRAFCGFKVRVEDLSEVLELVGSELARKPDQLSEKSVFTSIFTIQYSLHSEKSVFTSIFTLQYSLHRRLLSRASRFRSTGSCCKMACFAGDGHSEKSMRSTFTV